MKLNINKKFIFKFFININLIKIFINLSRMEEQKKARSIKKFTYRGKDIDALLGLTNE